MKIEFNSIQEIKVFMETLKITDESLKNLEESALDNNAKLKKDYIEFNGTKPEYPEVKIIPENKTPAEEIEITKEMLRERVTAIMVAGKGEQIRALISQHGATSIPTIKVEDYAIIYAEAKGLL